MRVRACDVLCDVHVMCELNTPSGWRGACENGRCRIIVCRDNDVLAEEQM